MHAYGSDRVRRGSGDQWIIFCPRSKGWVQRTPRTLMARERPGTAVLWEDAYFEVVSASPAGGGVRYVLEPWREEHVMRVSDAYDEAREGHRESEHKAAVAREAGRKTANLLGLLTGHLPAAVQEKLGSELGILPTRLTVLSLLLPLLFIGLVVYENVSRMMAQQPGLPIWMTLLSGYLGLESGIRLNIVWTQMRPIGSAIGWIAYTLFYVVAPNRRRLVAPVEIRPAPPKLAPPPVEPDTALNDAYLVREPLLTLLPAAEQRMFAERFGFDYRRSSAAVATLILIFCVLGVVTSITALRAGGGISPLLSLIAAGALAVEQVMRLNAFQRGAAGSVLAALVRPFTRRLLAMSQSPPPAAQEGSPTE